MKINSERLKQLRLEKRWSRTELAKKLSISEKSISAYENGTRQPKDETTEAICDLFNVTPDYLAGKADVKQPINLEAIYDSGYSQGKQDAVDLTEDEMEIIDLYRELDSFDRMTIRMIIDRIATKGTESESSPLFHYRTLDLYGCRPSAGTGNFLPESSEMSKSEIQVIDSPETKKADFVLTVDGSSMEPKFSDGDRILVQRAVTLDPGETGVFLVNGEAVIKQCQHGYLHSLNPKYPDITLDDHDDAICFGRVIGKI